MVPVAIWISPAENTQPDITPRFARAILGPWLWTTCRCVWRGATPDTRRYRQARESPADFHRRGEVGLKARLCETDEADEAGAFNDLDRPQSPAPLRNPGP